MTGTAEGAAVMDRPRGERAERRQPVRYTIGELAREFDVTLRTLRFYEDRGLLTPKRQGQVRLYGRRDRARLKLILMGKRVGFSLEEIQQLIDLYDLKDGQVTQLRVSVERFAEQIGKLQARRAEIDAAIAELQRGASIVERMLADKERALGPRVPRP